MHCSAVITKQTLQFPSILFHVLNDVLGEYLYQQSSYGYETSFNESSQHNYEVGNNCLYVQYQQGQSQKYVSYCSPQGGPGAQAMRPFTYERVKKV
ncbi:calcium-responsive transactivator-like [Phycodurus eques]|uniref:calcium-responsive transactivator-like n=1 Tax=Phycodurus eques TaxID=693459 RepID=UPI002ACEE198|nr:calcium-responsive transactivator-like [Phycodurus eques]